MKQSILLILIIFAINSIYAQNTQLDQRALQKYTPEQIQKMPETKIKQINFLYQHSFIIPDKFIDEIDPRSIDISHYSKMRLVDQQAKVSLVKPEAKRESESTTDYYIYLLSIDELKQAYQNIK